MNVQALGVAPAQSSKRGAITEFGGALNVPGGIAIGPNQTLYFTQFGAGTISTITSGGTIKTVASGLATEPANPGLSPTGPYAIAAGPSNTLWFSQFPSESAQGGLGDTTRHGVVTLFTGPPPDLGNIVRGPDGDFWYASQALGQASASIVKMTPAGVTTSYNNVTSTEPFGTLALPGAFSVGNDGNVWFLNDFQAQIGNITTAGTVTLYAIPQLAAHRLLANAAPASFDFPFGYAGTAPGPGGEWFTVAGEFNAPSGFIGRIAPSGKITEYGGNLASPGGIVEGPDGAMWFTESGVVSATGNAGGGKIGRITAGGKITEYGTNLATPTQIIVGPDGNLWFIENGQYVNYALAGATGKIGRIIP
ncbi:MAG TPA: hypothetical protein VGD50_02075 [Candidatus Baltobacteraceae bacterium]